MKKRESRIFIILSILSIVFLILAIVLTVKLIGITKEAKKIIVKGQDIADNANGIVENVKDLTSVGGVVKTFTDKFVHNEPKGKEKKDGQREEEER